MLNENEINLIENRRSGAEFNPKLVPADKLREDFRAVLTDLREARSLIAVVIGWRDEMVTDAELAMAIDRFRESEELE